MSVQPYDNTRLTATAETALLPVVLAVPLAGSVVAGTEAAVVVVKPATIVAVDPMTYGDPCTAFNTSFEHDVLLSVSHAGELAFWTPAVVDEKQVTWKCTGMVKTGKTSFTLVQCSAAKKTVLGTHPLFFRSYPCNLLHLSSRAKRCRPRAYNLGLQRVRVRVWSGISTVIRCFGSYQRPGLDGNTG